MQLARVRAINVTPRHNSEELYRLDLLGIGSDNSNSFSKVVFLVYILGEELAFAKSCELSKIWHLQLNTRPHARRNQSPCNI